MVIKKIITVDTEYVIPLKDLKQLLGIDDQLGVNVIEFDYDNLYLIVKMQCDTKKVNRMLDHD